MSRPDYSRPIKLGLADGLIAPQGNVLDFGCGRGDDVRHLGLAGVQARGWDPAYRPDADVSPAAVVNLGYVVNVIEDPEERAECLSRAWSFAERALIVSARLISETPELASVAPYGDGFVTSIPTFQKFYEQTELKEWIEDRLSVPAVAAGPGVFYVFRDADDRMAFLASRYRRHRHAFLPSVESTLDDHKDLLRPARRVLRRAGPSPGRGRAAGWGCDPGAVRESAARSPPRSTCPRCRGVEESRHCPGRGSPHLSRALEVRWEAAFRASPPSRSPGHPGDLLELSSGMRGGGCCPARRRRNGAGVESRREGPRSGSSPRPPSTFTRARLRAFLPCFGSTRDARGATSVGLMVRTS